MAIKNSKLQAALKEAVKEEVSDLTNELNTKDDEINLGDISHRTFPRKRELGASITSQEEIILDELLMSVPRSQGYYLKLYREKGPNEWELKQRIDTFETWSDMELEVTNLVRDYTKKSPSKWGSGKYRIIIWKDGGLRGPKHRPIDFVVDAQEEHQNQNNNGNGHVNVDEVTREKLKEHVSGISDILRTVKDLNPSINPSEVQTMMASAFKSGVEAQGAQATGMNQILAILLPHLLKSQQTNQPNQPDLAALIATIMSSMPKQNMPLEQPNPIKLLIDLKAAGLIPDQKQNDNDPKKIIELVTALAPIVNQGNGGDTSALTELIRGISPQLGKMVSDITSTIKDVVNAKSKQPVKIARVNPPDIPNPTNLSNEQPDNQLGLFNNPENKNPNELDETPMLPVFAKIKKAAEMNDTSYFPQLEESLFYAVQEDEFEKILSGEIPNNVILEKLQTYGGKFFSTSTAAIYLENFLNWMKTRVIAICPQCEQEKIFPNEQMFLSDNMCEKCGIGMKLTQNQSNEGTN